MASLSKKSGAWSGREVLDLLIEFTYLAVIFLIPLFFAAFFPTYNVFELNKIILFKILTALLLFFTALKIIFCWPFLPFAGLTRRTAWQTLRKYWLIPAIFIVGLALTLLFSVNPVQSFFGSYDRQQGWLSLAFYWLWFSLVSFNVLSVDNHRRQAASAEPSDLKYLVRKNIERIIKVAVWSGLIASLYGILQILGIDFLTWPEPPLISHRAFATFGQPNFLASWLLLIIPLSFYLVHRSRRFLVKFFYLLAGLAQIVALFFTSSRGAFVALILMALVYLAYLFFGAQLSRARKISVALILSAVILVGGVCLNEFLPNRLGTLVDYQGGSVSARLNFYRAAFDAWQKRPLVGYGLENGTAVFFPYYEKGWGASGGVGALTDRAHDLILDILISAGLVGLILFASVYYLFFRLAKENWRQADARPLNLALILGGGAYLVSLLFSFAFVGGEVYFWLFLALFSVLNFTNSPFIAASPSVSTNHPHRLDFSVKIAVTVGVFVLSGFMILTAGRDLIADYYFSKLYYVLAEGKYFTAFILGDDVNSVRPNPTSREHYDLFWGDRLSDLYPTPPDKSVQVFSRNKLVAVAASLADRGSSNLLVKAKIAGALGDYPVAFKNLNSLVALNPHWPIAYLYLAPLYLKTGDAQAAIQAYQAATDDLPDENDPAMNADHLKVRQFYKYLIERGLGDVYLADKDYPAAAQHYQAAYRFNPADFTLFKRIADAYYLRGDLPSAIRYNTEGWTRHPGDYHWPYILALLYREAGDKNAARNNLNAALRLSANAPELLQLKLELSQ